MQAGDPAQMVYFDVGAVTLNFGGMLPADLDGTPPPDGTPNYFVEWDDSTWLGDPDDTLRLWEFFVDWTSPENSTFGANAFFDPNTSIATADVDPDLCGFDLCIPQPDPGGQLLDPISDRLMFRLQYRDFGSYQTLVSNHTVDVDATDHAGIHWFELRNSGAGWAMNQEGVYGPDADHRWMGSIAMDASGDMALGYSVSSGTTSPSVRYDGRLNGDPAGTLPQGETTLIAGSGYQTHPAGRWGDYSMMAIDPTDDCTFWYTQEYLDSIGVAPWQTRIGSFTFPSCTPAPSGALEGTVTEEGTGDPIEGAKVKFFNGYITYSDNLGEYGFANLPVGSYSVTVSAENFSPVTIDNVEILDGETTLLDVTLSGQEADLSLSKEADLDPVSPGMVLTYTLTVSNAGPNAAGEVTVDDTLPSGVTLVSVSSSQGDCTSLPCNLGEIASGVGATVEVVVKVEQTASNPLVNTAQVSSSATDSNPDNNSDSLETEVIFHLYLPIVFKSFLAP
jgi:uncharacterized repeat protein (TIGR01451 family)